MKWMIGCSGFSYKSWQPLFYPEKLPAKDWFEFYCEHFNTVELNVTFYRFPTVHTLTSWYNRSPDGFAFAVKAPRLITHYKQLKRSKTLLSDFYLACNRGLKEKLGPVLFQFPERFNYTEERLQRIIDSLDTTYTNVVEFRHSSWWNEEVYTLLENHKIVFCSMSFPGLPDNVIDSGSIVYYRFHGVPELYTSLYSDAEIDRISAAIESGKGVKKAWCYFNNDVNAAAITNARRLQDQSSHLNKNSRA